MIKLIFYLVANSLLFIARKTNLTYNEINILVYYFLIPFTWLWLADEIVDFHYFKIGFGIFVLGFISGCRNFKTYSDWLFAKSVGFLNYFNKFGSNYFASSVLICVSLPILIYIILIYFAMR